VQPFAILSKTRKDRMACQIKNANLHFLPNLSRFSQQNPRLLFSGFFFTQWITTMACSTSTPLFGMSTRACLCVHTGKVPNQSILRRHFMRTLCFFAMNFGGVWQKWPFGRRFCKTCAFRIALSTPLSSPRRPPPF
jgi:hypothetical protein